MRPFSVARAAAWLALPCLACSCTVLGDSPWNGGHASIGGGYLEASLEGQVDTITEVSPGVTTTTEFDFDDNGGQDDPDAAVYVFAQVGVAPIELRLSAFQYRNQGTGTFSGEFIDTTFTSGTVESEFAIGAYQALLGFDLVNIERIRIGALAGGTLLDLDLSLTDVGAPAVTESVEEVVPVPLVGARGDLKIIGGLWIGATAVFFPLDEIEDFEGDCYDIEAGIHFELVPSFELFAIYREIVLDAEGEVDDVDTRVDLQLGGPVFGVALTF